MFSIVSMLFPQSFSLYECHKNYIIVLLSIIFSSRRWCCWMIKVKFHSSYLWYKKALLTLLQIPRLCEIELFGLFEMHDARIQDSQIAKIIHKIDRGIWCLKQDHSRVTKQWNQIQLCGEFVFRKLYNEMWVQWFKYKNTHWYNPSIINLSWG